MNDTYNFFARNADTDVTFVVGDKKLFANRKYLSMTSPVFRAMFEGQFTEGNSQEVVIQDSNAKAFADFLSCIYPSFCKPNDQNFEALLHLADYYQVSIKDHFDVVRIDIRLCPVRDSNTLESNRREKEAKTSTTTPVKEEQKEEVAALKTALNKAVAKKKAAGLQMSSSSSSIYSTPYTTAPYTTTESSPMTSSAWQNRGVFNPYTIGHSAAPSQSSMMERILREEPDRFRYEYQFKIDLTQDTPISIVHR
ncbi:hypothetical protein PRIPAC_90706 [Pristionchus pacificus]|uniref:BTB domain-containing protein n=1 Tax=Pristionchus pacificus TaxID=54126 RepID=A0A2A6CYY3_PRIPA|nr:hypothetical protein PRIPAC_90706 [Pristionchus pacificus]|eukprot:PDM83233.1 BTB domain-containing protein [Pristionchus pacificus]